MQQTHTMPNDLQSCAPEMNSNKAKGSANTEQELDGLYIPSLPFHVSLLRRFPGKL